MSVSPCDFSPFFPVFFVFFAGSAPIVKDRHHRVPPYIKAPAVTYMGPITRARARQLNYQVLSFLGNPSNVHEHMMLPKLDTFVLLMNEGPSMDKKDGHWSGIKHGAEGPRAGRNNGVSSGDFRTLKPP